MTLAPARPERGSVREQRSSTSLATVVLVTAVAVASAAAVRLG